MDSFVEEILLSNKEIVEVCERLGEQITADYRDKKPILVGLLKGSIPFLAELMKHIKCDLEVDFMQASSYVGVKSSGRSWSEGHDHPGRRQASPDC